MYYTSPMWCAFDTGGSRGRKPVSGPLHCPRVGAKSCGQTYPTCPIWARLCLGFWSRGWPSVRGFSYRYRQKCLSGDVKTVLGQWGRDGGEISLHLDVIYVWFDGVVQFRSLNHKNLVSTVCHVCNVR